MGAYRIALVEHRCWCDYKFNTGVRVSRHLQNGPKSVSAYDANSNIIIVFNRWQLCARNVLPIVCAHWLVLLAERRFPWLLFCIAFLLAPPSCSLR